MLVTPHRKSLNPNASVAAILSLLMILDFSQSWFREFIPTLMAREWVHWFFSLVPILTMEQTLQNCFSNLAVECRLSCWGLKHWHASRNFLESRFLLLQNEDNCYQKMEQSLSCCDQTIHLSVHKQANVLTHVTPSPKLASHQTLFGLSAAFPNEYPSSCPCCLHL